VWKLTSWDDRDCLATYQYLQAFTADQRHIVFASNRTGRYELYRMEVESGRVVQLTERRSPPPEKDPYGEVACHMHRDGRELFYFDGPDLIATDVRTLEDRAVLRAADCGWRRLYGFPSFTPDGRQFSLLFVDAEGRHGILLGQSDGTGARELYKCPALENHLTHCLILPAGPLSVTFNIHPDLQNDFNLPPHSRARAWKLSEDGTVRPFLVMLTGFRATHEYWGPSWRRGEPPRLYYHRKSVPGWTPTWIESVSTDGLDCVEHYGSPDRMLGHSCVSPDGRFVVTDVQDPRGNELIRIDLATGRSEVLCWPNSTASGGNFTHVHPSLSPRGDMVLYTSDAGGKCAVFVLPLKG
jgi:hypothetical protein